jgi:hypothetical protein
LDVNRLSRGEKILGAAAGLLFISSFLPFWAKFESKGGGIGASTRYNAWDAYNFFPVKLAIILALVAVIWVALRAFDVSMNLPTSGGMVAVVLGGLTLLLMLIGLLTGPAGGGGESFSIGGQEFGYEVSRGLMLFVGIVLAAGMAYGGYLAMSEDTAAPAYQAPAAPPPGPPPAS